MWNSCEYIWVCALHTLFHYFSLMLFNLLSLAVIHHERLSVFVLMCWCSSVVCVCVCVCVCVGKEMVDFIQQYLTRIRERRVVPDVQPGYMRPLLPSSAPNEPEDWSSIMRDVENIIMPGVCLSVHSSVCLSFHLSVCLSICLTVWPSVFLIVCLSISRSIHLSICVIECMSDVMLLFVL